QLRDLVAMPPPLRADHQADPHPGLLSFLEPRRPAHASGVRSPWQSDSHFERVQVSSTTHGQRREGPWRNDDVSSGIAHEFGREGLGAYLDLKVISSARAS